MSRQNNATYTNNQRAGEMRDAPAHAHEVGEEHGKQEHLTGAEHSRQSQEHSQQDYLHAQTPTVGHGIVAFGHEEIAAVAHQLWEERGCPEGSPQEDWFRATELLRSRKI